MRRLELFRGTILAVVVALFFVLAGCGGGSDGSAGPAGATGATGATGTTGATGAESGAARVADKHGVAVVTAEDELQGAPANPKYLANIAITGVTATATAATVTFTLKNKAGVLVDIPSATSLSAGLFKLAPKDATGIAGGVSYNKWVSYKWTTATAGTPAAGAVAWPKPATYTVAVATRESVLNATTLLTNPLLVKNSTGNYTYTFALVPGTATMPTPSINAAGPITGTAVVGFDATKTHRVLVDMGGHAGPTGEATFDFRPDGVAVGAQTRNIVETATCKKCHGPEFAGHGGDRVTVQGCVTCHSPGTYDPQSGESMEMAVMIHKIHAGNELTSVAGPDGRYYDDPATVLDETADNGKYAIWGNSNTRHSWENAAFPAVIANCESCHTGTVADVGNWRTVPSRAACGSCHDNINWATGAGHSSNRIMTNDDTCVVCHFDTGASFGQSVTDAHNWTKKDIRNIQEFDITVTTDTPSRGYYINGEKPVVSIALKDHFTGAVIVPSTVIEDTAAEGCIPKAGSEGTACTVPKDGLFRSANVYVTGPRAEKSPVLTYAARAMVRSATVGPWNLSAGGGKLTVKVDSGMPMLWYDNTKTAPGYGADYNLSGTITVTLPAAGAALEALFPSAGSAAATPTEVAAWLNANSTFKKRAIAYVDEALAGHTNAGRLAIRSRGISKMNIKNEVIETTPQRNIQLVAEPVVGMFAAADVAPGIAGTTTWKTAGGADSLRIMATANATNPKGNFTNATAIKYTLDPVDDLVAGTYIIHVEYNDGGSVVSGSNYRTPSVALATFQVKTATVEKPVAGSCDACHWSSGGIGFVLDPVRHNKIFDDKAVDRCGGCHDYSSGQKPDTTTQLVYGGSLSNRVHSVHNGVNLNYPTITVAHEETSAFGRNWRITYPMDVRNCESCHPAATTSGTWKTNANRLACAGCHDSDAATAHIKLQTFDPTPLAPFSGDEQESCKSCH